MGIGIPSNEILISFKGDSVARFNRLVEETGTSDAQIFADALGWYEELLRLHKAGHKIYSDETGEIVQMNIFD